MTISTTANKIIYSGNGATTSFPFTFPGIAAAGVSRLLFDVDQDVGLTRRVWR